MKDTDIDLIDKRMIQLLAENGRKPAREIATALDISVPTVQSRMKRLLTKGVLKVAGLVNTFKTKGTLTAIIAIRVDDVSRMAKVFDQLGKFDQVVWAAAVTGQYDMFAEIIITEGIEGIFNFYVDEISKLDGVAHSESFMVTRIRRKWTLLPPNLKGWL
jgi:Lrp/AsnC family transcriptional regulator for asnA, asnC and gidA